MGEGKSPYQKASSIYLKFMSVVMVAMAGFFMYVIAINGNPVKNIFFWFLAFLVFLALLTFIKSGSMSSRYGKEHYYKEMRSWELWAAPGAILAVVGIILNGIFSRSSSLSYGVRSIPMFMMGAGVIYIGIIMIKRKTAFIHHIFKLGPVQAVISGIFLLIFGMIILAFSIGYVMRVSLF